MPGETEQIYTLARPHASRRIAGIGDHRRSVVVVGAQAIYLHTGEGDLAVSLYTSDADLAVDPRDLAPDPKIESLLQDAGFVRSPESSMIGTWIGADDIPIDLLVPEALSGRGRRSVSLGPQGDRLARRARGLEAALVDNIQMTVEALDSQDMGRFDVAVAAPADLLVAKLHKIADRKSQPRRQDDKDALDVYRLLQAIPTDELAAGLQRCVAHELSNAVTKQARVYLRQLFGTPQSPGAQMAARAAEFADPEFYANASAALADDLLAALA